MQRKDSDSETGRVTRGGLSIDEFVRQHAHPFLLRRRGAGPAGGHPAFDTSVVSLDEVLTPSGQKREQGIDVYAVQKALGNPFPDRISVGRAGNCDIVIRDPSVSKLHAHFRVLGPDRAELNDVKSVNGTRVNGQRIQPGVPVEVAAGDTIVFGGVEVQFVNAEAVYQFV